jgi:GPH family glycoside/pentoside/hexuronide:cation symporter
MYYGFVAYLARQPEKQWCMVPECPMAEGIREESDMAEQLRTPQKKYLSRRQMVIFGLSGAANSLMHNSINDMVNLVFNVFLGLNPVLISVTVFCSRFWDAFTDPFMGAISDNTRTRFGRRRPYMLIGGIVSALLYILLWRVPVGWSQTGHFLWLLIGSLLFFTAFTVFSVPCQALSCELSPDYDERTRIMAVRGFFSAGMGILMPWMYHLTQMECFEDTLEGMQTVSIGVALIMVVTSAIPSLFTKEREELARTVSRQEKVGLLTSLKITLKNRTFALVLGTVVLTCLGVYMVNQLGMYVNIFYVFGGDKKAAAVLMGLTGMFYGICSGILGMPLISFFSGRFGKKRVLCWGMVLGMLGAATKFWTFNPHMPYLELISLGLLAPSLAGLWMLTASMVADICDEDELQTGVRREGMYNAVYSNVLKIGMSVGVLLCGFILNASGFRADLGEEQSEQPLFIMRILFAAVPAAAFLLGLLLILRYPITKERAAEVRQQLDARHDKMNSQNRNEVGASN